MGFLDKIKNIFGKNKQMECNDIEQNINKQIGLEVKLPGCSEFVPLGKAQYNRIYLDDIGPRLMIIVDECAELLEPSGVKTTEGKEEDALKQEIVGLMKSITQLGRSSGIHMVVCPLRLSTIVPTIYGYKTMATIKPGDYVFDINNKPTKVMSISSIKMSEEMYEFTLVNNDNNNVMKFGADYIHRFPIIINGKEHILETKEIYNAFNKNNDIEILTHNDSFKLKNIYKIKNELVRCIEVESDSHLFLITDRLNKDWICRPSNLGYGILSKSYQSGKLKDGYIYFDPSKDKPYIHIDHKNANTTKVDIGECSDIWIKSKFTDKFECILTHNTQRNDASIIPGVIQNNPLSIDTKVKIRRKL